MFNFKKVSEVIKKVTSTVLTATLSLGMFSASPINAMGGGGDIFKKIIFIGSEKSGKTQLRECMMSRSFEDEYIATIGMEFEDKDYEYNNNNKFRFWDTVGQDIYRTIASMYCKGASAIVLTVAYDDENWKNSMEKWLEGANEKVNETTPVKIVLTKSDLDKGVRKFTKEKVENCLDGIKDNYKNLNIDTTVIETSAKNNTGINYKGNEEGNEEGNSQTCLEDYLLDLVDKQQKQPDLQQEVSTESELLELSESEDESEIDHNMQNKPSVFEKAAGVAKKHPAISIGAAVTLATVFVVTPLVIFKNKIIKGVKTISAKIQNKKPVAKKIRTV